VKLKLDRIISLATLTASLVAIVLVLKRPAPVAPPAQAPVAAHSGASDQQAGSSGRATQNADGASFEPSRQGITSATSQSQVQPQSSFQQPHASAPTAASTSPTPKSDANINSEAISAMLAKTLGAAGTGGLTPDSNVGSGEPNIGNLNIKDQQVTMDGDIVHGKFLTEIAGKDVWITISGHMGEKDGYATFDPTEFKVGDMDVPVELVNPALQRKLAEERDRLKVPNNSQ
jgi:hypothetical protein